MWLIQLATRYALRNPMQTLLVAVCIAVTVAIPISSRLIVDRFDDRMGSQADAVPVVVGPRGSRFDLVLSAVFYRSPPERTITMAELNEAAGVEDAEAVPMSTLFTAGGARLVCVGHGFYGRVGLAPATGSLPLFIGDATIGSALAERLGLGVGDSITTDRHELFDLSVPPPISLSIVGVLEETGTGADETVFASIETAWLIGGQAHGHAEGDQLTEDDIIAQGEGAMALKPTLETETAVTAANLMSIHAHADPALLPITAVLVFADDPKPLTLAAARFEGSTVAQAVVPRRVIDEMMQSILRVLSAGIRPSKVMFSISTSRPRCFPSASAIRTLTPAGRPWASVISKGG